MSSNPGEAAPASRSAAPRSAEVGVAALSPMGPVLSPTMVICFDFPLRDPRRRARPGPLRGRRHRGSGNHLDSFTPASLFTAAIDAHTLARMQPRPRGRVETVCQPGAWLACFKPVVVEVKTQLVRLGQLRV